MCLQIAICLKAGQLLHGQSLLCCGTNYPNAENDFSVFKCHAEGYNELVTVVGICRSFMLVRCCRYSSNKSDGQKRADKTKGSYLRHAKAELKFLIRLTKEVDQYKNPYILLSNCIERSAPKYFDSLLKTAFSTFSMFSHETEKSDQRTKE